LNEALTAMIKTLTETPRSGPGIVAIRRRRGSGSVARSAAMQQLPSEHQIDDVSRKMPSMRGRAITVKGLLDIPALQLDADHVTFHSADGQYAATLTLAQAKEFGLLVYELDGEPLADGKGGPFRLITPGWVICAPM
jgi:2-dehydropantoate 2-reductase